MNPFLRLIPLAISLLFATSAHALTVEHWLGLPQNPSILTLQREGIAKRGSDTTATLTTAHIENLAAGTGVRLRGSVIPSASGSHVFAISGSKNVALWLSSDDSRFGKQLIAWHYETSSLQQWTKFASQQSASIELAADTRYYIEAQVMSSATGGHLSLGWKVPGSTQYQVISGGNITALEGDPADLNNNGLPDDFETQSGLAISTLLGASAEHGVPDQDGITNFEEFLLSSDPLVKEARSLGITRDIWTEIQGQSVAHLTGARSRFLFHPNATSHVPNIDETHPNQIEGKNYAARYRGFLVVPVTGTYYLWVAGDDQAELWFADGSVLDPSTGTPLTNRFGKQLLAHTRNPGGSYSAYHRDFDLLPSQRTRALNLVEGQTYYLEVLHKNESIAGNHVSVAWTRPGASRAIIPSSSFLSDTAEEADADHDSLPNDWESAAGLSTTDNGRVSSKEGQYGDFDADGLCNLLEFQIGTDPKKSDTDGDGMSDFAEINYYNSNPLVANTIATTTLAQLDLTAHSATSVPWEPLADGSIRAYERRGWTEWTFTVPTGQEGIHEIRLTGGGEANLALPISFQLNGEEIARQSLAASSTQTATLKQLTPWLHAGTHTLRIQSHNARTTNKLILRSLSIHRLGGTDANTNGIADWAEIQFNQDNRLTRLPAESLTSPAFLEGTASSHNALAITRTTNGSESQPVPTQRSTDQGFFVNVPLDAGAPTELSVSFQGGAFTATHSITWAATNILAHNTLTLRQGDSLRLTAHAPNTAPSGTFAVGGETLLSLPADPQSSAAPVPFLFDTPGTHTITAIWTPEEGEPQTNTLTVHVRTANFGPAFILQTYNRRTWAVDGVNGMDVEADSALYWRETTATGAASRSFLANAYTTGKFNIIARVPETGEIIATGEISAFSLARATETGDAQTVDVRSDGSKVIRFTIVAENLPPNAEIRITMNYQGTVFPDGSRTLILRASDFSSNGVANVLVEASSDPPQLCHSMNAFLID